MFRNLKLSYFDLNISHIAIIYSYRKVFQSLNLQTNLQKLSIIQCNVRSPSQPGK